MAVALHNTVFVAVQVRCLGAGEQDVIANEPGCIQFTFSRAKDNDHFFTLAEFYVDEAALDAHRESPHFALFQKRLNASKTPVLGEVVFPA